MLIKMGDETMIRQIWAVYFSATGTTECVVQRIAHVLGEEWNLPVQTLDFTLPAAREKAASFSKDDLVILGTPVYAGRVPNILLSYLNEKLEGNHSLAVPVVLYGNRNYDDALMELRNILEEHNFHTIAAGAFIGEHSFSCTLGKDRPDTKDLLIVNHLADLIFQRVNALKELPSSPVTVRGEEPVRPYYTPRDRQGNPVNILKVKPKVNENCTQCGICAGVCPMGSIDPSDVSRYNGICIKCGACIKKCPEKARYYDDAAYLYHKEELELEFTRRAEPEIF